MNKRELRFTIEDTTPQTLPMARLAVYLKDLATILGSEESVHFIRVDDGSAACVAEVDDKVEEAVISRVHSVRAGNAPKEAAAAFETLLENLRHDELTADLELPDGEVLLEFQATTESIEESFGPFWQEGSLEGILVKIGGLDETVPVHLIDEGAHHVCNANKEIAKALAPHLFGNPIRVHGRGRWHRNSHGQWEMKWFDILHFEILDDTSLLEVVARLRGIRGNDLLAIRDPLEEMRKIRHGDE